MKKNVTIAILLLVIVGLLTFKKCEDLAPYLKQIDSAQKAVNELQKAIGK